jgi:hypothetical protein
VLLDCPLHWRFAVPYLAPWLNFRDSRSTPDFAGRRTGSRSDLDSALFLFVVVLGIERYDAVDAPGDLGLCSVEEALLVTVIVPDTFPWRKFSGELKYLKP